MAKLSHTLSGESPSERENLNFTDICPKSKWDNFYHSVLWYVQNNRKLYFLFIRHPGWTPGETARLTKSRYVVFMIRVAVRLCGQVGLPTCSDLAWNRFDLTYRYKNISIYVNACERTSPATWWWNLQENGVKFSQHMNTKQTHLTYQPFYLNCACFLSKLSRDGFQKKVTALQHIYLHYVFHNSPLNSRSKFQFSSRSNNSKYF